MKRLFAIAVLTLFSSGMVHAQYYFYNGQYYEKDLVVEVGGSIGLMNAFTDLGGRKGVGKKFVKDFNFKNNQLNGGLFISFFYKNQIGLRLEAAFGKVKAYDSILKNVAATTNGRYYRNLEFRSNITEVSALLEVHPFELLVNYNTDRYPPPVSPYAIAGIGYFHFNPQATLNNNLVDLQPLSLEGQGFPEYPDRKRYSLSQICFPLGAGVRYDLSPILNIRLEMIYRILTTDYLDDVSTKYIEPAVFANYLSGYRLNQALLLHDRHIPGAEYSTAHPDGVRGNDENNDGFITFNLKIGLTIGRERR